MQIKEIEKENINDKESDTQKDNTKEVKDKEKPASVSMSQYRASLRYEQFFYIFKLVVLFSFVSLTFSRAINHL